MQDLHGKQAKHNFNCFYLKNPGSLLVIPKKIIKFNANVAPCLLESDVDTYSHKKQQCPQLTEELFLPPLLLNNDTCG